MKGSKFTFPSPEHVSSGRLEKDKKEKQTRMEENGDGELLSLEAERDALTVGFAVIAWRVQGGEVGRR